MTLSKQAKEKVNALLAELETRNRNKKWILKQIKKIVMVNNPTDRTITVRYSNIKKMFKDANIADNIVRSIKPKKRVTQKVIRENVNRRDEMQQMVISAQTIEKIFLLNESNNFYDLAIYLLFCSGRRTRELFDAEFQRTNKRDRIRIIGVKKRSDYGICDFQPICEVDEFFDAYDRFIEMKDEREIKYASFSRQLNREIKRSLKNNLHPHNLRGMYVTYMFKHRNKKRQKINPFIRNNLCHQSLDASLSYTQYVLED